MKDPPVIIPTRGNKMKVMFWLHYLLRPLSLPQWSAQKSFLAIYRIRNGFCNATPLFQDFTERSALQKSNCYLNSS
jgi:hypothetical protein